MKSKQAQVQPHRLGRGWHFLWPEGDTSEGCIMLATDAFARRRLGTTAQAIYTAAYNDGRETDWLESGALLEDWGAFTVLPSRWTVAQINLLFYDLQDVNYHSFLGKLIELVEQRHPELARRLPEWHRNKETSP